MRPFSLVAIAALTFAASSSALAADEATPVANYRKLSFALTSSADLFAASPLTGFYAGKNGFGGTGTYGIVGLGANARFVYEGLTFGAQLNVFFNDAAVFFFGTNPTILVPGLMFGYAIPLTDHLALTPMARASFLIPTGNNSSIDTQLTGDAALEIFLGKNGFIEPYVGLGLFDVSQIGEVYFLMDFGYRLGVVF